MNRTVIVLLACALLIIAGCAGVSVTTDYDEEVDFSSYRTFRFAVDTLKPGTTGNRPQSLLDKRVKRAIESEMEAKGYQLRPEGKPDLLVAYKINVRNKADVTTEWHKYRWRTAKKVVRVDRYKEGTMVLDFIDPDLNQLVWRGWGTGVLGTPDQADEDITKSIRAILKKFPPGD